MKMENCIFCKISAGEIPSHKVWEDEKHLAFLSIYPEIEGMTIVIPKEHKDSYIFNADAETVADLMEASRKVAQLLDTKLDNVLRTKLVFEGLEVPHLHAKLYPMYTDKRAVESSEAKQASDEELKEVASKITS
jgi:histidine triad (HIT) family protein